MKKIKGRLMVKSMGGGGIQINSKITAVAAAASVPDSLTKTKAL
jgi:hypothetical protein